MFPFVAYDLIKASFGNIVSIIMLISVNIEVKGNLVCTVTIF
jgi:hypothetical protein